ncbi:hypothetical protein SAMN02745673_04870 [Marinactinospora thermotolerans DSM 45154]|uniref:Uncharacterized protein n=1 Tax=Marinactinospora thermotolerans DSM 45154 TaxID=1122192 RepID=A0A1T4TE69_9ACTN|nr:hypothetical protein SAMN02745673_04870 [Marinactinospora thermotolerans DSM 45154]
MTRLTPTGAEQDPFRALSGCRIATVRTPVP